MKKIFITLSLIIFLIILGVFSKPSDDKIREDSKDAVRAFFNSEMPKLDGTLGDYKWSDSAFTEVDANNAAASITITDKILYKEVTIPLLNRWTQYRIGYGYLFLFHSTAIYKKVKFPKLKPKGLKF